MGDRLSGDARAYQRALDYLFVRTTGAWRFGLERTQALLDALGNPERELRVVHVGGTNGKGSVCAIIERALRDRGLRVAKYTSPHLVDFRERILIDGKPVHEQAVVEFVERWTPTIEALGATFFEATTAMAFLLMARAKPDIAIVEVGLGGRLDSTNVVDPLMAIVTSIGIDHTQYLGDTRELIATEKAGIFKAERPAIVGDADPAIRELLCGLASAAGSSPVVAVMEHGGPTDIRISRGGTDFTTIDGDFTTGLFGRHQAQNAAIALCALDALPAPLRVSPRHAKDSLKAVRLAGRFDLRGHRIFDVAHNREGAAVCAATLSDIARARPVVALLSVLSDKDWRGMMAELAPVVDMFVLATAPTSPESRTWNPADAKQFSSENGWNAVLEPDFDRALALADREGQTVLVTGSFHTVGDAMARLQVSPLAE